MKLKDGFITHDVSGMHLAVATGEAAKTLSGLLRSNETGSRIVNMLMEETSEETIVNTMAEEYDAPKDKIAADVHRIIEQLRVEGLLDE